MPGIRKKASYLLEYAAARAVIALLRISPYPLVLRFGGWLGKLAWQRFHVRRNKVLDSLAQAFPEMPPVELDKLGQTNYTNLGRWFVEMFLAPSLSTAWMTRNIEHEGREVLDQALSEGRGVVNVT